MWNITRGLINREYGFHRPNSNEFFNQCCSSDYIVQRLCPSDVLKSAYNCELKLMFSPNGNHICMSDMSGFVLWDWFRAKKLSHHHVYVPSDSDLFIYLSDVQFVTGYENLELITAEGSGCVDYRRILPSGGQKILRRIFLTGSRYASRSSATINVCPRNSNELLCADDDGIYYIDFRSTDTFFEPINRIETISCETLAHHPFKTEFMFCCHDGFVRFYDSRYLKIELKSKNLYKPKIQISCCKYNFDGTEILMSGEKNILIDNESYPKVRANILTHIQYPQLTTYFGSKSEYFLMQGSQSTLEFRIRDDERDILRLTKEISLDFDSQLESFITHPTLPLIAVVNGEGDVRVYSTKQPYAKK